MTQHAAPMRAAHTPTLNSPTHGTAEDPNQPELSASELQMNHPLVRKDRRDRKRYGKVNH